MSGILLAGRLAGADEGAGLRFTVEPDSGAGGQVAAPWCQRLSVPSNSPFRTAPTGLVVREVLKGAASGTPIPAQFQALEEREATALLWWLMPPGDGKAREFELQAASGARVASMRAEVDAGSSEIELTDSGRPVLRYQYRTVYPGSLLERVHPDNRKYAQPRSNYIQPLFGPDGQELTKDWPLDHPHHRGIYWAWPEVDYQGERGDLHALQRVFARGTGQCAVQSGPVFAQVEAENLWQWDDREPIVRERAIIRAYREMGTVRCIDLELRFEAVGADVALARRGTDQYGGLNIRLAAVRDQRITFHTDPPSASPRIAWADLSGAFGADTRECGLAVLQAPSNPDYPGDWIKFPELNWFQPTFPAAKTRFVLRKDQPLVLRYRLLIHPGSAREKELNLQWHAYRAAVIQINPLSEKL